jgi:ABC-2 type transport system ATP-binding protein
MDVIQDVCERVVILKEGRVVADDRVDSLLALFRTRAYRVVLSDGLAGELVERLARVVSGLSVTARGERTELEFELPTAERLYQVIDIIREGDAVIETITQKEPDLEEAFLRVINETAPEGGAGA